MWRHNHQPKPERRSWMIDDRPIGGFDQQLLDWIFLRVTGSSAEGNFSRKLHHNKDSWCSGFRGRSMMGNALTASWHHFLSVSSCVRCCWKVFMTQILQFVGGIMSIPRFMTSVSCFGPMVRFISAMIVESKIKILLLFNVVFWHVRKQLQLFLHQLCKILDWVSPL